MEKYFNEWVIQAIKSKEHLEAFLKASEKVAEENKELLMQMWDDHFDTQLDNIHTFMGYDACDEDCECTDECEKGN
jgi:hypothetical protein